MPIPDHISTFTTESLWLTLPYDFSNSKVVNKLEGGIHAVEHAIITMTPKWISCDPNDIGGAYELNCRETSGKPTIFIYDNFPGGAGLASACFRNFDRILSDCIKLIKICTCREPSGCPSCIQLSKCTKRNDPLDKECALKLLEELKK